MSKLQSMIDAAVNREMSVLTDRLDSLFGSDDNTEGRQERSQDRRSNGRVDDTRKPANRRQDTPRNVERHDPRTDRPAPRRETSRSRFATKGYIVKRNRKGNPVAEPKRPADLETYRVLARRKTPTTILELEESTGKSNAVLRNNLYRMQKEGVIDTVRLADED